MNRGVVIMNYTSSLVNVIDNNNDIVDFRLPSTQIMRKEETNLTNRILRHYI